MWSYTARKSPHLLEHLLLLESLGSWNSLKVWVWVFIQLIYVKKNRQAAGASCILGIWGGVGKGDLKQMPVGAVGLPYVETWLLSPGLQGCPKQETSQSFLTKPEI